MAKMNYVGCMQHIITNSLVPIYACSNCHGLTQDQSLDVCPFCKEDIEGYNEDDGAAKPVGYPY